MGLVSTVVRHACCGLLVALWLGLGVGCASHSSGDGFFYKVRKGETLYSIGRRYEVHHERIRRANEISDVTLVQVGQLLWIPAHSTRADEKARRTARDMARKDARKAGDLRFDWPVRGRLTSRFGRRNGRPHEGLDVAAPRGTLIRAAESGKVIHCGHLGAYGRVVILKHRGHYRSVYAHTQKTLVSKGDFVERGEKIAKVGTTGRSTGPHLHFEIRHGENPRDPLLYLP